MQYYERMKKETLTVEKDECGRIIYRNASGEIHNPHGAAFIWANSCKAYWIKGKLHNPNGPAVIYANGDKLYYTNGQLHNENGPAIVWANGKKEYWINDKLLNKTDFKTWQAEQTTPK